MALLATRDLSSVQASLGHKSRDITEKYAKAVALLSSGTAEKTASIFDLKLKESEGARIGSIHVQNHVLALEGSPSKMLVEGRGTALFMQKPL